MNDISFTLVIPILKFPGSNLVMILLGLFLLYWLWKLIMSAIPNIEAFGFGIGGTGG